MFSIKLKREENNGNGANTSLKISVARVLNPLYGWRQSKGGFQESFSRFQVPGSRRWGGETLMKALVKSNSNSRIESNRIDCTTYRYLCIGGATTATPLQHHCNMPAPTPKMTAVTKLKIFSNLLTQAESLKEKGNKLFSSKDYIASHNNYSHALHITTQLNAHCDNDPLLLSSQRILFVSLIGNNALVLYKLGRYSEMQANCNSILSQASIYDGYDLTKIWYRRALAREALGQNEEAKIDLEHCMRSFGDKDEARLNKGRNDTLLALERVNNRLKCQFEKDNAGTCPSSASQRHIISTLLSQASVPRTGEAFYLLDFDWWRLWCNHVNFHAIDDDMKLKLNIIIPDKKENADTEEDDRSSSEEESDDDSYCDGYGRRPGAINNRRLLISSSNPQASDFFFQEWRPQQSATMLIPQLVRGHHFEILPRDAYAALKSWYGEICANTTICRRAMLMDKHGRPKVFLYPNAQRSIESRNKMGVVYDQSSGRVGLNNLGNTCFMNSALQCLSHATPLTRYFLTSHYKKDINVSNPLGTGGKLAAAYDTMVRSLWMGNSRQYNISPRALKRAIALFAPRFAGTSQHDSQEFLAFLLDGLHEDLNRVRNPPYIEKADVNHEHDLNVAGAEAWDAHCKRNQSIVHDTFYGQFKSTCICPNCKKISVSFDAFNHVSLEIPQLSSFGRIIPIIMFSANSHSVPPTRYGIVVSKNAHLSDVKLQLSRLSGVPIERLSICDIYQSKIYEIISDSKNVSDLNKDDTVMAYEIDPYTPSTMHVVATQFKQGVPDDKSSIGYPLLTSFSIDLSCRQVKEHMMNRLSYLPLSNDSLVKIRIVDNNGAPLEVFENSSSIIPNSDEKLASFLKEDCAESFLFAAIEWSESSHMLNDNLEFIDHSSLVEAVKKHRAMLNRTLTLDQCLDNFTRPERLDEDNKWYCTKCKYHVRAEKTMKLWRLPNVLVIHFKRFEFRNAMRREKLDSLVEYPLEGLNMNKYCASSSFAGHAENGEVNANQETFVVNDIPATYDLFGCVNHYGRMGFGHYNAYARRWNEYHMEDDWRLFDDSSVRDGITETDVVSNSGYLLFYRRRVFA